jgi:hypothetical protein
LTQAFETIGARIKVHEHQGPYALNVRGDRAGEFFDLAVGRDTPAFHVLQTARPERHLLLFASDGQRFLCGHDERHWFVAGVRDRVSTVTEARASLLPAEIRGLVGADELRRRRNKTFVRQGEWFFVPAALPAESGFLDLVRVVHRDEPLFRNARSKPHRCQYIVRRGGEVVHFVGNRVYTDAEFAAACAKDRTLRGRRTRTRVRNPEVFARGYVRHPDHATIVLRGWHRVHLNAEFTTDSVTFYD